MTEMARGAEQRRDDCTLCKHIEDFDFVTILARERLVGATWSEVYYRSSTTVFSLTSCFHRPLAVASVIMPVCVRENRADFSTLR